MKNYQQSVKQRRANLEKAKRELRHSNPRRVFSQAYTYKWWGWTTTNTIAFRGHKL